MLYFIRYYSVLSDLFMLELDEVIITTFAYRNSSRSRYFFYDIVTHNEMQRFESNYADLNLSYWRLLFEERFANLRILNMALICNDLILELVAKHCPLLEYLNASSKYIHRNGHYKTNRFNELQLPVSDDGLQHLKSCKYLRELVINEPRGDTSNRKNQITYNGLRHLLRNIKSLEDISYSDIGNVITTKFDDIESLNLKVMRHHNPTAATIQRIFYLCKNIERLHLVNWNTENDKSMETIKQLCYCQPQLKSIDFQNISFDDQFNGFFQQFGANLVSISLVNTNAELNFNHFITISINCPNLTYLMCTVSHTELITVDQKKHFRPFQTLKSLHLTGYNIQLHLLLPYCTEYANSLETITLYELTRRHQIVDFVLLSCIKSKSLNELEISRLLVTKAGIENLVSHFECLQSLRVSCTEDCQDIIDRLKRQNYEFSLKVKLMRDELNIFD